MNRRLNPPVSTLRSGLLAVALTLAAGAPAPAAAQKLCAPANTWTGTPTVDGTIAGDLGWAGAARYVFANGTAQFDGAVDLIRNAGGSTLYLGFEMHNDGVSAGHAVDQYDAVAIAFDVPNANPEYRLIVIQPSIPTGNNLYGPDSGPVSSLQFATSAGLDGTGRPQWQTIATPAGASAQFTSTPGGGNTTGSWYVELQVPTSALGLPASGDFGLYVDGMRADAVNPNLSALVWPPAADPIGGTNAAAHVLDGSAYPQASTWGKANLGLGAGCAGIYFAGGLDYNPTDIYVNTPGSSLIQASAQNQFFVKLHNSGPQANDVVARFQLSGQGINGTAWDDVPKTPASGFGPYSVATDPAVTVGQSAVIQPSDWSGGSAQYKGTHVCMLVELDLGPSAPANVNFLNKSAIQNMDWSQNAGTEGFRAQPTVDARRWKPLPGEQVVHLALQTVARAKSGYSNGLTGIARGSAVGQVEWAVHGYLATGRLLTLGGKTFRVQKPVGGFEYVIQHALKASALSPQLAAEATARVPERGLAVAGTEARVPPLYAGRWVDPGLLPVAAPEGFPSVTLKDWAVTLAGARRGGEDPHLYVLDLQPGQKATLDVGIAFHQVPCGCPRIPGASMALVALGLVLIRRRAHRRR